MRCALLLMVLGAACAHRAEQAEVRGRVKAADGSTGVACHVEISTMPPSFSPESAEVKTGDDFSHIMATSGVMKNMYAAVRCEGYGTRTSRMFELEAGQTVDLGELVVSRK